jgi:hypothetical protein
VAPRSIVETFDVGELDDYYRLRINIDARSISHCRTQPKGQPRSSFLIFLANASENARPVGIDIILKNTFPLERVASVGEFA